MRLINIPELALTHYYSDLLKIIPHKYFLHMQLWLGSVSSAGGYHVCLTPDSVKCSNCKLKNNSLETRNFYGQPEPLDYN